jgi:hypothetical protein
MREFHAMAFLNLNFDSEETKGEVLTRLYSDFGFDETDEGDLWIHGTVIFDEYAELGDVLEIINVTGVDGWYDIYDFRKSIEIPLKEAHLVVL